MQSTLTIMRRNERGFTLTELLVAMLMVGVIVVGGLAALMTHGHTHVQQNMAAAMEQNLRVGMGALADGLRSAGYGVPAGLTAWVPWKAGLTGNPTIGTNELSILRCTPIPVLSLTSQATKGGTGLQVQSEVSGKSVDDLVNATSKRLLYIGDNDHVQVTNVSGDRLTIDTDPATAGNQGLSRVYPAGTPLCRVDVLTFTIETNSSNGLPELLLDENQGAGAIALAEGINALQVIPVKAGKRYTVTLTAQTDGEDPVMGRVLTRTLVSDVTLRNSL